MSPVLRTATLLVWLVLGGVLASACGADGAPSGDAASGESAPADPSPADPSPADPSPTDPTPSQDDRPDGAPERTACDAVVAGIEAFNRREFEETVAGFERALPLAEAEDAEAGTQRSADLLEAVEYYAALPAEEYPVAAATSPDFAKYKAITLGQCGSGQPQGPGGPGGPDDGTVEA